MGTLEKLAPRRWILHAQRRGPGKLWGRPWIYSLHGWPSWRSNGGIDGLAAASAACLLTGSVLLEHWRCVDLLPTGAERPAVKPAVSCQPACAIHIVETRNQPKFLIAKIAEWASSLSARCFALGRTVDKGRPSLTGPASSLSAALPLCPHSNHLRPVRHHSCSSSQRRLLFRIYHAQSVGRPPSTTAKMVHKTRVYNW